MKLLLLFLLLGLEINFPFVEICTRKLKLALLFDKFKLSTVKVNKCLYCFINFVAVVTKSILLQLMKK